MLDTSKIAFCYHLIYLPQNLPKTLPDKSQPLYVYCRTGIRSAQAVSFLQQLGYTNMSIALVEASRPGKIQVIPL